MKRTLTAGLLALSLFTSLVGHASAVTIEELQVQLQALLEQIATLQAEQYNSPVNPGPTIVSKPASVGKTRILRSNLGLGSRGADVVVLQDFLRKEGYLNEDSSGYYGYVTVKAVSGFQTANGIEATGYVGAQTREVINSKMSEVTSAEEQTTYTGKPRVSLKVNGINAGSDINAQQINAGNAQTVSFSWSSSGASNCNTYGQTKLLLIDGTYWDNYNLPISGTKTFSTFGQINGYGNPVNYTAIGVQCWNSNMSASDSKGLTVYWNDTQVSSAALPTVDLKVNNSDGPVYLTNNEPFSYRWTSTNSIVCQQLSPMYSGVEINGSTSQVDVGHPYYPTVSSPSTITISCQNSQGQSASDTVKVYRGSGPSIETTAPINLVISLTASPSTITVGQSTSLYYSETGPANTSCTLDDRQLNLGAAGHGSITVTPNWTTTYKFTCTGSGVSKSTEVTVTVNNAISTGSTTSDPYTSPDYKATSGIPLSSNEKSVEYEYPNNPCGSLMTSYTSPGSVSVGNGPVYSLAAQSCGMAATPNISTFRTYSCQNFNSEGTIRARATFAFQCTFNQKSNVLDGISSLLEQIRKSLHSGVTR